MAENEGKEAILPGTLYLVGTPIGNLRDISQRALEVLGGVDFLLCEDTRHSAILLDRYGIRQRLVSYFAHNEAMRTEAFVPQLAGGASAALITDAGMPGISDPGSRIVDACLEAGVRVCPVPGASACVAAVASSGFYAFAGFEFVAFFPRQSEARRALFSSFAGAARLLVGYESPQRVASLLEDLVAVLGADRRVCLCRELTKKFETVERMAAGALLAQMREDPPRGELCLVVEGAPDVVDQAEDLSPEARSLAQMLFARGMHARDIRDVVSSHCGVRGNLVYRFVLGLS